MALFSVRGVSLSNSQNCDNLQPQLLLHQAFQSELFKLDIARHKFPHKNPI